MSTMYSQLVLELVEAAALSYTPWLNCGRHVSWAGV